MYMSTQCMWRYLHYKMRNYDVIDYNCTNKNNFSDQKDKSNEQFIMYNYKFISSIEDGISINLEYNEL